MEDLAPEVRDAMTLHLLDKIGEAINVALQPRPNQDNPIAETDTLAVNETLIESTKPKRAKAPAKVRMTKRTTKK